tara:strand:- start:183 stop:458 length:276 start_codon:yes stop_codon:yes gene_type:complete
MTHILKADYEGASLELQFDSHPEVSLKINGVQRDHASSPDSAIILRLGSPVQTGYEQHEFIQAVIQYDQNGISASLHSGDLLIAQQEVPVS